MNADIAVFGSGFAAFELTRVAAAAGESVIVIEKGAATPCSSNYELSRVRYSREPIVSGGSELGAGAPEDVESLPRYVGLGGTSEFWSGKWRRLDKLDLERSADGRRWLLNDGELRAWYDEIDAHYGKPDWSRDATFKDYRAIAMSGGLRLVDIYEETPPRRIRPMWTELTRRPGVNVICGANVVEPVFDSTGDLMRGVQVRNEDGEQRISARRFVVACGGIESVHLSHQLRASSARGPGKREGLPTQYGGFMDHPKADVGEIEPRKGQEFVAYLQHARASFNRLLAFSLPEDELADRQLGNHTLLLWPREGSSPSGELRMVVSLEQFPESDNCVLTEPKPLVSWRLSRRTWVDGDAFLKAVVPRLERLIGPARLRDVLRFRGASHHAGALPIGEAGDGQVDRDCRFHNIGNLYCVSSAVFPTAGSANPTMTVVALARRLAHHLQGPGTL